MSIFLTFSLPINIEIHTHYSISHFASPLRGLMAYLRTKREQEVALSEQSVSGTVSHGEMSEQDSRLSG